MKQTILKPLLAIACLLFSSHAFAHDFEVDGIYYNITDSTNLAVEVTKAGDNTKYTGSIDIPASVIYESKTYTVSSIGDAAFFYCSDLTSITIPNSVTNIGNSAFSNCFRLTSITIPNSVTSIGAFAFFGCHGLTAITIPNSVTDIGIQAFSYCRVLTSITIPNSVTNIGRLALLGCNELTSIIVENGNTVYDSRDNSNAIIDTSTNTLIAGCRSTIIPNSDKHRQSGFLWL